MGGAVRVAGTIRRPPHRGSTGVRALLRHLESAGFAGSPRWRGIDELGRDVLTYLTGETVGDTGTTWPAWVWSDSMLVQVGGWLRRLHDASQGWQPEPDLTWFSGRGWAPNLVIGHHDAAPWNVVVDDGRLVGFFDWDTAGPATRAFDLAFTAITWVPLLPESMAADLGFSDFGDRSRRLHLLLDAYGYDGERTEFGDIVARRALVNAGVIRELDAAGNPIGRHLIPWAKTLERIASDVCELPPTFWAARPDSPLSAHGLTQPVASPAGRPLRARAAPGSRPASIQPPRSH